MTDSTLTAPGPQPPGSIAATDLDQGHPRKWWILVSGA
jgi:hypothetical protein